MYPYENEERKIHQDTTGSNVNDPPLNDPPQNGVFYGNPVYNMLIPGQHPYSAPARTEPMYNVNPYGEPVYYNEQGYVEHPYQECLHNEPCSESVALENAYNDAGDDMQNMYSPGLCVNRPFPRNREHGNGNGRSRNGNGNGNGHGHGHESSNGLVGFLRAMALVLACAFFSGSAAYLVLDYRINKGDFNSPPQVILGSSNVDRRNDDNAPTHFVANDDGMTAQDIYDMARNQVVVINTDAPGINSDSPGDVAPISGSGFIISTDGYIITNYHVIEIAQRNELPIRVILNDGTSYDAKVVGFEESNDVAVLKIEETGLSPVFIGDSDNIRVGQTIYAIGNPFGDLVYTMTDGIVSALDRVVTVERKSIRTFQFSAAVNSGNSGGPIYNTDGEVIGIVTAKVVRGNVEGIGFAIPINDAVEIATELIEHGYISGRPLIGITGQNVSPANAEYFNWVVGIYIRSVSPGSAADIAGMEIGDIITALNGIDVNSMDALRLALRTYKAGDTTTITIWRDGESYVLPITFDEDMYAGQQRPYVEPDSPDPFENRP